MDLTFATLMARAGDEPDAMYGLAAKSVQISPDKLVYRFTMRPEARFHDGSKLTAQDAAFSMNVLKEKGHPLIIVQLRDMVKAEAPDDATVIVTFRRKARPRRAAVMSRACRSSPRPITRHGRSTNRRSIPRWDRGRTRSGNSRSTATSNSIGSRIGGRPTFRSTAAAINFDTVRYEFYRDRDVAFEGFTGKNYLFREEFTARVWATRYDFPAVKDGRVKRETLPDDTPSGGAGLVHQYPPRAVQGPAGARGDRSTRSISNGPTRPSCTAPTRAPSRRSRIRTWWRSGRRRRKNSSCWSRSAARCRTRCSASPIVPPVSDGSGQDRALLRKAVAIAQRCRLRHQGRQAGAAERRALQDRIPARRAVVPAASRAPSSRTSASSGSTPASG